MNEAEGDGQRTKKAMQTKEDGNEEDDDEEI